MARPTKYGEHRNRVLTLIQNALAGHTSPPTVRALAEELEVGVATMHSYLGKMAEEGLITWRAKSHRSIRVTRPGLDLLDSLHSPPPVAPQP